MKIVTSSWMALSPSRNNISSNWLSAVENSPERMLPSSNGVSASSTTFSKSFGMNVVTTLYLETEGVLRQALHGFRPARSMVDMLFVRRRLRELERQTKTNNYACFINLQKTCKFADLEMPWKVLTRSAVSTTMRTIVRNFHEGFAGSCAYDDGEHLEWCYAAQGQWKVCVVSPLQFKVFFAAGLHVI